MLETGYFGVFSPSDLGHDQPADGGPISVLALHSDASHIASMALGPSQANFKARPVKVGDGWYVRVTWDNGRTADVPGFANEADAEQWIRHEAAAWLEKRHTGSHDE